MDHELARPFSSPAPGGSRPPRTDPGRAVGFLARWARQAPGPDQPRAAVVIDGLTGSGKTELAARLLAALAPGPTAEPGSWPPVALLEVESLVAGWSGLASGVQAASEALASLAATGGAVLRTWSWDDGAPGPVRELRLPEGGVLVIEGCGALAAAARPLPGMAVRRVLVEAPKATRRARIASRDAYEWEVPAWEAQEREVAVAWRGTCWGPDLIVGS